jgi:hypothetical protein
VLFLVLNQACLFTKYGQYEELFSPTKSKARGLAQHGGLPFWLEETQ